MCHLSCLTAAAVLRPAVSWSQLLPGLSACCHRPAVLCGFTHLCVSILALLCIAFAVEGLPLLDLLISTVRRHKPGMTTPVKRMLTLTTVLDAHFAGALWTGELH